MTVQIPAGTPSIGTPPAVAGVTYANAYTQGGLSGDHTAALQAALAAARAKSAVGVLILDAAQYRISAALDVHNVFLKGQGSNGTSIYAISDWASALPINSRFMLDQQPSVPLGAPTQTAASQAGGSSAYTLNQVLSAWVTASNSRNGGETPVSGRQAITISGAGNVPTFNWTAISNADSTTTYNVYLDRSGGTDPTAAVKVASGQSGTSWADTTGTGGSGHPPTTDTTGGVGILAPDPTRVGASPTYGTEIDGVFIGGVTGVFQQKGVVPAHLSGIHQGGTCVIRNCRGQNVFALYYQNGDHEKIFSSQGGGYYSVYRGEPTQTGGDQVIRDCQLDGAMWAGIGLSPNSNLGGARLDKVHLGSGPFGIYKEAPTTSGRLVASGCTFTNVQFESCGNGNIFVAGSTGATLSNNVFDECSSTNALDTGQAIATTTTDWTGQAIGRLNAVVDLGSNNAAFFGNTINGQDFATPKANFTSYSECVACSSWAGGNFYNVAQPSIDKANADGKLFTNAVGSGTDTIFYRNTRCLNLYAQSGGILQNDLVEQPTAGGQPNAQRSTGANKAIGVAMLAAGAGQPCIFATVGLVSINSGANVIGQGVVVVPDTVNPGQVKAGTLSSANIVGTAMAAASGGAVEVLLAL